MYYVTLFDKHNKIITNQTFSERNAAIKYFNMRCDVFTHEYAEFMPYSRIEIGSDGCVLFDYEVPK